MSTKSQVLAILLNNQGQPMSGEAMAQQLSLSRTAIWKAIQELKKEGHSITSTTNRGYDYLPSDILSKEGIATYLKKEVPSLTILVEDQLASTNQTLKKMAIDGANNHTLLITNTQTQTRGRFGRSYFAPETGQGIYFSLLLHTEQTFQEIAQYTLITAVAMARTVEHYQSHPVTIKWVNDLYLNQKKLTGILSEAITDFETQSISSVIIGVGTNFAIPETEFPTELQGKATSIFPDGQPTITRNQLVATFLNEFYQLLTNLDNEPFIEEYRKRSFVIGRSVTFTYNRQNYQGIATGISDTGELIVTLEDGESMSLASGEISLSSY